MVKGVNKTVIVVNDTGSKLFEKIVFYVTDEYGNLNPNELKKATNGYTVNYSDYFETSLRQRVKNKRKKFIFILSAAVTAVVAVGVLIAIL